MSIKNAIERAVTQPQPQSTEQADPMSEKARERADSSLMHLHVPKYVRKELVLSALNSDVAVGRLAIEVLKSWANAQIKKREGQEHLD